MTLPFGEDGEPWAGRGTRGGFERSVNLERAFGICELVVDCKLQAVSTFAIDDEENSATYFGSAGNFTLDYAIVPHDWNASSEIRPELGGDSGHVPLVASPLPAGPG